jgi:hypothetical protein
VKRPRPPSALLSPHRFENELGIRHGTAAILIRENRLRAVPLLGRVRIPRAELERIVREGLTPTGRRPRARKVRSVGTCDPDALRALDLETL